MKKTMICLCLLMVLVAGIVPANAATVQFKNEPKRFEFDGINQMTTTDLFENFKDVLPGDTISQEITVTNKSPYEVRIFLTAWAEGETYETEYQQELAKLTDEPRGTALTHERNVDFLEKLMLDVDLVKGSSRHELSDAPADEPGNLKRTEFEHYGVILGTFKPNGSATLDVTLTVPADLGNEFMNRTGLVPWTFTVVEVPKDDTPDTGDWFSMPVWIGVGVVLAAGIVFILMMQRKRRTEN